MDRATLAGRSTCIPTLTAPPPTVIDGVSRTSIAVEADGRTRLRHGVLRAQQSRAADGAVRIGLLATTALLLGGDTVELDITVGEGARLELYDVAGTVAYDGRGRPSAWHSQIRVAAGGRLRWSGEPFVVADGADVTRTLDVEAEDGAAIAVRETLVLGRTGERGGRLHNRTAATRAGRLVLLEDQLLDPDGLRTSPGLLGANRVIDTVLTLGGSPALVDLPGATTFRLVDGAGRLHRFLGTELASSPLHTTWRDR